MASVVRIAATDIPSAATKLMLAGIVNIPPIAIGTWSWGDTDVWAWGPESEQKAKEAFDTSVRAGINFFDTAEVYGKGESERAVARYKASHAAGEVIIATKFLPLPYKLSYPGSLIAALKSSLERLQMTQVDLYQIHGPIHIRSIETVAGALAEAVKQGLTKTVGVSNYSTSEIIKMYESLKAHGIQLASNQVEFSLLRRIPETSGLIKACHDRGIAVLAYSPLAMGRLTGKYSAANPPPAGRRFSDYKMETIQPLLDVMTKIATAHGTSVSSVALNWIICKGAVPLAGAKDAHQAEQNSQALGWRLTDDEIGELEKHSIEGKNGWIWQHG